MRPPDCYVCHLTLHDVPDDAPRRDYFTLVYFGATEEARMAPGRAMAAQERTGHPSDAAATAWSSSRRSYWRWPTGST
jgi:hypothetical protein